jgi:hypothetical protein
MNRKSLTAEDRRAIDLILDHGAAHRNGSTRVAAVAAQPRVAAATRLLAVLNTLPAAEPPADLVARTMGRIAAATQSLAAQQTTVSASATLH